MSRRKLAIETRTITPAVARVMLDMMGRNRQVKPALVRRYAKAMRRGTWALADPLLLSDEGRLIQGQHRLLAVIEVGKPITFAVASGFDADACFLHLDKGGPRTFADDLYLKNHEESRKVSPMLGYFWRLQRKMPSQGGGNAATDDEKWDMTQTIGPDRIGASVKAIPPAMGKVATRALMMALHLLLSEKDKLLADVFMSDLASGVGLGANDAVHVLRERLIEARRQSHKSRMPDREIAALTIKAWNAVRTKRKISKQSLRWRSSGPTPEPFPTVE